MVLIKKNLFHSKQNLTKYWQKKTQNKQKQNNKMLLQVRPTTVPVVNLFINVLHEFMCPGVFSEIFLVKNCLTVGNYFGKKIYWIIQCVCVNFTIIVSSEDKIMNTTSFKFNFRELFKIHSTLQLINLQGVFKSLTLFSNLCWSTLWKIEKNCFPLKTW